MAIATGLKYALLCIDSSMEGRWENKSAWMFFLEFIADLVRLFLYLLFFMIICTYVALDAGALDFGKLTLLQLLWSSFASHSGALHYFSQLARAPVPLYPVQTNHTQYERKVRTRSVLCPLQLTLQQQIR